MTQRLSLIIAVAFGLTACVADQPLLTTGIFSVDDTHAGECNLTSTSQLVAGSLDLAGGGRYVVDIGLRNDLILPTEAVLASAHAYTITIDTVTFTYTSVPAISFASESTPLTFTVAAGSSPSTLQTYLFTRNALEKLFASLPGTTNVGGLDVRDVKVKIVFSGSVASGGRISSTPVIFPITVFNTGLTCPTAGDSLGLLGPCGNPGGQDGARVCCASDVTCVLAKK